MAINKSIVIVNEYTVKGKNGKGSRGSTPGNYVTRYMAREQACEPLSPAKLSNIDSFVTKYMARDSACENTDDIEFPKFKRKVKTVRKKGGYGFGKIQNRKADVSLSHDDLNHVANSINARFENGNTVMKTIISFEEEYLRENGIIDEDFYCKKRGDYRGNIDQLKLRRAIMNGVDKMSRSFYDDLEWVGVIQVDTKYVHAHLAMTDCGSGNVMPNGEQRGKIDKRNKDYMRRGIDLSLDDTKSIPKLSMEVDNERRNVKMYIKRFTHDVAYEHTFAQSLLSILPENKTHWRAKSNRKSMKRANSLARRRVNELFEKPDSGYDKAYKALQDYARYRQEREGLDEEKVESLIENGKKKMVDECVNEIYNHLKELEPEEFEVDTPILNVMSAPIKEVVNNKEVTELMEFGVRLRSYSSRLEHHKAKKEEFRKLSNDYKESFNNDASVYDNMLSRSVLTYYDTELEYHSKLVSKYQHFLSFNQRPDDFDIRIEEMLEYKRLSNAYDEIEKERHDYYDDDAFAHYIEFTYDIENMNYVVSNYGRFETVKRINNQKYHDKFEALQLEMRDYGARLYETESGIDLKYEDIYPFSETKGLDLHDMNYDFANDEPVGDNVANSYIDMMKKRADSMNGMYNYLQITNQTEYEGIMDVDDVRRMISVSHHISNDKLLYSDRNQLFDFSHDSSTISLDKDVGEVFTDSVSATSKNASVDPSFYIDYQ